MTIKLNGQVVSDDTARMYRWWGYTNLCCPGDIQGALDALEEGDTLEIEVNSGGGSVYMGFEMYSLLKGCGKPTVARVLGLAGSAMSVAICGCDRVEISPVGNIMIHRASTLAEGNSQDMKETKQMLDTIDESILNAYVLRCGESSSREQLKSWMKNETFFTAEAAVKAGLADAVMFQDEVNPMAVAASAYGRLMMVELPSLEDLQKMQNKMPMPGVLEEPLPGVENLTDNDSDPEDGVEYHSGEKEEKEMEIKNAQELREAYAELVAEIEAAARQAEQERIAGIYDLHMAGMEDLVEAAVKDPAQNAGTVAIAMLRRQKSQGTAFVQNAKEDAEKDGANAVPAASAPQTEDEDPAADAKAAWELFGNKE